MRSLRRRLAGARIGCAAPGEGEHLGAPSVPTGSDLPGGVDGGGSARADLEPAIRYRLRGGGCRTKERHPCDLDHRGQRQLSLPLAKSPEGLRTAREVNLSDRQRVGPHRLSALTSESIPENTGAPRFRVGDGQICSAIGAWCGALCSRSSKDLAAEQLWRRGASTTAAAPRLPRGGGGD